MFTRLTRLLFGGEEEVSEDVKSGEVVDEGWLVVPHQEAASSENQDRLTANHEQCDSAPPRDAVTNMERDSLLAADASAPPSSSSTTSRAVSSSIALTELTRCTQKTKPWPVQHPVSRNAIQRQNRARQGVQHTSFQLQQPAHRSLGH